MKNIPPVFERVTMTLQKPDGPGATLMWVNSTNMAQISGRAQLFIAVDPDVLALFTL